MGSWGRGQLCFGAETGALWGWASPGGGWAGGELKVGERRLPLPKQCLPHLALGIFCVQPG